MIRYYLLILALGVCYSSQAQTDTLTWQADLDLATAEIHDTIPSFLSTKDHDTTDEWQRDTFKLKDATIIVCSQAEFENHGAAYVAIQKKESVLVWWLGVSYILRQFNVDTITLYNKVYLKVDWNEGEGRWWYDDRSEGVTLLDIDKPFCLLHLITYRSLFETDSEDRYSDTKPSIDCDYKQPIRFDGNLLIVQQAQMNRHVDGEESSDCPAPYIAGRYIWNGFNWILLKD